MNTRYFFSPDSLCTSASGISISSALPAGVEERIGRRETAPLLIRLAMRISRSRSYSFLRRVFHYQNGSGSELGPNPFDSRKWMLMELVALAVQILITPYVLVITKEEKPVWPMRIWVTGYAFGCFLSLILLLWRYRQVYVSAASDIEQQRSSSQDESRNAQKCKTWLELLFAIWFVMGNVWVFDTRLGSYHRAPKLNILCVSILAWNAVTYSFPFILFVLLCCCVPLLSTLLGYNMNSASLSRGATHQQLSALPTWRYKDVDLPQNHEIPECCICLAKYRPEDSTVAEAQKLSPVKEAGGGGGGGWGGWGFSLSYLSDLQKAAAEAAEEISRNAVEAARTAAKSISETVDEDSESSKEDNTEVSAAEEETDDERDKQRKEALDKLEKASEESFLSQGLKVIDTSVETFASGAWQALGSAWKGIENSATNLADSIQHGGLPGSTGPVAPSLLETGKAFTAKGMHVLEQVGKDTMDLLISETGILVDKKSDGNEDEDQLFEEISFDRCFYIYGGPEQLEELEALSNHYALLYNRRKAKLSSEEKSIYDGKLKEIQSIFDLGSELDGNVTYSEKGKGKEAGNDDSMNELKKLHDSSVRKAAELAAGFASALAGLAPNDIIQRTSGRLDTIHSEGVHRLSEICCFAVTQLLMLGKSIISNANKVQDQEIEEETVKIDWPEDSVERAKIIRTKAQSVTENMEAVCNGFVTGISDVAESYSAAIKSASAESQGLLPEKSIQEKASLFTENLRSDHSTAVGKMQDGLQYLTYLVISTSMPAA